ncbi:uncharacterized protein Z519_12121 [Cladophialophora bantiana CBS 173.52]|uniref:VIT domain-containing protein n=1 Tax=Cladophialophora bantiana (strain ATCC 10958 / CBS 173.52 / CDC B-1940 / NIH 8579) TaxID=1442370 RepID=A0A0D2H1R0_CLAB1|nr:uncharacterized protein Z519_12121 [Cladophialophora bantiana CBS 173.52]KIW87218.1 hypothetical protein Z519_12121 [Cladophialophora bantiana CBS 173.52]
MSSWYHDQRRLCGCYVPVQKPGTERKYLPQIELSSHTKILATTSRTTLKQSFVNNGDHSLDQVHYTFPLYDGVSVVGFKCTIGAKTIVGAVKERQQAKAEYQAAVAQGEAAALLEQLPEASDVFTTSIGNVPAAEKVHVELVYLGELKRDAETDGSRFTIPTIVAPRYGPLSSDSAAAVQSAAIGKGRISICVDVTLEEGLIVRGLQSPSHPIAVTMGRTSIMAEDSFNNNHASATLTLGTTELEKDFILVVLAEGTDTPRALLETHSTIPNQRALMATLVPKFNLPNISPEIVFIVDRSGSMHGKIGLLVAAMKVFLKSLPVGVKFNICSFGTRHSFLFKRSKTYDQSSLKDALKHLETFAADYGGTEMLQPVKATVENRYKDLSLEVMLLTDGEIWNQDDVFAFVKQTPNARFFTLGIGDGASSALVEGVARAGNGFAQFVGTDEKLDNRVVRMLKGALTPHITDYTLEVQFGEDVEDFKDEDFEMVDPEDKEAEDDVVPDLKKPEGRTPISLFNANATEEPTNPPVGRYESLPTISVPRILQAPHKIPPLFRFNRTTVYLLFSPEATRKVPKSVVLRGTSAHGPLELKVPVQDIGMGETIHQLAAKKAILELEEGRGWITEARSSGGQLLESVHEGKWDLIVEREAVRLGVLFQVGGKWCSFVAVDNHGQRIDERVSMGSAPSVQTKGLTGRVSLYAAPGGSFAGGGFACRAGATSPRADGQILRPSAVAAAAPPPAARAPHRGGLFGSVASTPATTTKKTRARSLRMGFGFGSTRNEEDIAGEAGEHAAPVDLTTLSNTEKMHQIIGLEEFDGSWLRSKNLLALLGVTEEQFTSVDIFTEKGEDAIKATVLAVAWLKVKVLPEKDVWEMVADKAMGWLATRLGGEGNANKAVEQAKELF